MYRRFAFGRKNALGGVSVMPLPRESLIDIFSLPISEDGPDSEMADNVSVEVRSRVMGATRARGNLSTELALARAFRLLGVSGWRRHLTIPGRPDFAFRQERLAIFADGCFWHGCPRHCRM